MKLKWMSAILATLLAGMMLFAGCGNSKTDDNSKKDAANLPWGGNPPMSESAGNQAPDTGQGDTGQNDVPSLGKITEEDDLQEKKITVDGKEYTVYEVPGGAVIPLEGKEMTRDEINSSIEDVNRQNRNK